MEKIVLQCLESVANGIEKQDITNKRLIICIIVLCISFLMCVSSIACFYFFSDYDYIDASQEVITDENTTNQTFKTGGD